MSAAMVSRRRCDGHFFSRCGEAGKAAYYRFAAPGYPPFAGRCGCGVRKLNGVWPVIQTPFLRFHSYSAQVLPCHRTQRRTARRVWRTVVLATHTPLMRVLPGPQPTATCVIISFGAGNAIGAGVMACADAVTDREKSVTAINLIMVFLLLTVVGDAGVSGLAWLSVEREAAPPLSPKPWYVATLRTLGVRQNASVKAR